MATGSVDIATWKKPLHTLIIDADGPLYQSMLSAEEETEWEEDVWTLTCDHRLARASFDERIRSLQADAKADTMILCFSDKENFRKDIFPPYKSNRKSTRKPVGYKEFRQKLIDQYDGFVRPRLEADDCVGILATKVSNAVIFSHDKDLMQIPGKHLIEGEIVEVTEDEADLFHLTQTLTGDAVDGYSGCPGIGPVKAASILSMHYDPADRWMAVVDAYTRAKLTEEEALVQARVARILRSSDWNSETKTPILWTPIK